MLSTSLPASAASVASAASRLLSLGAQLGRATASYRCAVGRCGISAAGRQGPAAVPMATVALEPTACVPERLNHNRGDGGSGTASKGVHNCLNVIARAFVSQPGTSLYVADPAANGVTFWQSMASEILHGLPHDPQHPPLFALPSAAQPEAAAIAYVWRPNLGAFAMPATESLLRPEVAAEWEECGELWHKLLLDTYAAYGPFINIDFIGVLPEKAGLRLGRRLLDAILADADAAGRAVFLAACGADNAAWYERHGFRHLHYYYCEVPGVPGHSELTFQVRPPQQRAGGEDDGIVVAAAVGGEEEQAAGGQQA